MSLMEFLKIACCHR